MKKGPRLIQCVCARLNNFKNLRDLYVQALRQEIFSLLNKKQPSLRQIKKLKHSETANNSVKKWLNAHGNKPRNLPAYCPLCLEYPTKRKIDLKDKHLKQFRCRYIDFDRTTPTEDDEVELENDECVTDLESDTAEQPGLTDEEIDGKLSKLTNGQIKGQKQKCKGKLITELMVDIKVTTCDNN